MSKRITVEKTDNTFFIRAREFQAVQVAQSNDPVRYYLHGVYVHKVETTLVDANMPVIMVATDGAILMKHESYDTQNPHVGDGIIVVIDPTAKGFKAKAIGELWLYGDTDTGLVEFLDVLDFDESHERLGVAEFGVIDGTFPDYTRVIPCEASSKLATGGGFAVNPNGINRLAVGARKSAHCKDFAMMFVGGSDGSPIRVTFSNQSELLGVIMPMRM